MKRHGFDARVEVPGLQAPACDVLAVWGVRRKAIMSQARANGTTIVVLERGYLGNRKEWTSVSVGGGLNGRGKFGPCRDNGERFRTIASLTPWKDSGGRGLILGQVPTDMSLEGLPAQEMYAEAVRWIRSVGLEPWFRPHPMRPGDKLNGARTAPPRPIEDAFDGVAVAVTINSNSGVDAVLAGVPLIVLDRGSMAWDVAGHEFAPPPMPDRGPWAAHLAWKQWRMEEIAAGDAWAALAA